MNTDQEIEVEIISTDIIFANNDHQCVHKDALESILDELELTFEELADLGEYMREDGIILEGDKCIRFQFRYHEEMIFDYAHLKIHNLLMKYDYLQS